MTGTVRVKLCLNQTYFTPEEDGPKQKWAVFQGRWTSIASELFPPSSHTFLLSFWYEILSVLLLKMIFCYHLRSCSAWGNEKKDVWILLIRKHSNKNKSSPSMNRKKESKKRDALVQFYLHLFKQLLHVLRCLPSFSHLSIFLGDLWGKKRERGTVRLWLNLAVLAIFCCWHSRCLCQFLCPLFNLMQALFFHLLRARKEYTWSTMLICYVHLLDTTAQKSHYPPANHHAIHLEKCPISRS